MRHENASKGEKLLLTKHEYTRIMCLIERRLPINMQTRTGERVTQHSHGSPLHCTYI